MINLTRLDLSFNKIRNIEPLIYLNTLEYLNLAANKIDDVSVLENNIFLKTLNISSNNVSDISKLDYLDLNELNASNQKIQILNFANCFEINGLDNKVQLEMDLCEGEFDKNGVISFEFNDNYNAAINYKYNGYLMLRLKY